MAPRKNAAVPELNMEHAIHRVTGFQIVGDYTLMVRFADGTKRTIDFLPILAGELYGPLHALSLFNQVALDSEVQSCRMAGSKSIPFGHTNVWTSESK